MVAVTMPSNLLSYLSPSASATLPSPLQSSTRKPLTDDVLHFISLRQQLFGSLAHQFINRGDFDMPIQVALNSRRSQSRAGLTTSNLG